MFTIFQKLEKAVWDNKDINDLPDSAFLYIESGGKKDGGGKTVPRGLRHFPYMDIKGKIDLAHIKNAIARIPQSKCGLDSKEMEALQNKARNILEGNKGIEKGFYIKSIGSNYKMRADSFKKSLKQVKEEINALAILEKANKPIYYGPRGGRYSDSEHKIPYTEEALVSKKNPWEMSSSQWLSVNKIPEPWVGEISPMQYSKLNNRAKKEYDIKRNREWALASKGKEDWRNKIYSAYKSGKFKLEDKGLNLEVINAVKQKSSEVQEKKQQQSFEEAEKSNKISDVSEVKMGDKVFHIIYRKYGVINKIGKNTVSLVLSNGDTIRVKPSLLNRYSYSDLQNKYGVNKSIQNAVLNTDLEKEKLDKANKGEKNMSKNEKGTLVGTALLKSFIISDLQKAEARGGKYIRREAKPGGGYTYYYGDEDKKKGKEKEVDVDEDLLYELELSAANDAKLYNAKKDYDKLMVRKMAAGTYNSELAPKGWGYYVDKVISNYELENKMPKGSLNISKPEKMILAKKYAKDFEQDIKNNPQDYKQYVPKKYADKWKTKKSISNNIPIRSNPPVLQPHEWMRRANAIYEGGMSRDNTIDLKSIGNIR